MKYGLYGWYMNTDTLILVNPLLLIRYFSQPLPQPFCKHIFLFNLYDLLYIYIYIYIYSHTNEYFEIEREEEEGEENLTGSSGLTKVLLVCHICHVMNTDTLVEMIVYQ